MPRVCNECGADMTSVGIFKTSTFQAIENFYCEVCDNSINVTVKTEGGLKMLNEFVKEVHDIERDIELAKMMADDIDKVYKKHAKGSLQAQQERLEKIRNEKYHGCADAGELEELYAYGDITLEEYDAGRDWFEGQKTRTNQLSLIEQHRRNLKDLRDKWKGTVAELQEELDDIEGKPKVKKLNAFEKIEQEERAERIAALRLQDCL